MAQTNSNNSDAVCFEPVSFFEALASTARETTYTAALAWLLGEYSDLELQERARLLSSILPEEGVFEPDSVEEISCQTEWNKIDLLITIKLTGSEEPKYIAVENKIKASQYSGQLAKYDDALTTSEIDPIEKLLLTLRKEGPKSGLDWKPVTYDELICCLEDELICCLEEVDNARSGSLTDYLRALKRLVAVRDCKNIDIISCAFKDKKANIENRPIAAYMLNMRLNLVLQQSWFDRFIRKTECSETECSEEVKSFTHGESRGQALLNLNEEEAYEGAPFSVGVQLQRHSLKLFCRLLEPSEGSKAQRTESNENRHEARDRALRRIQTHLRNSKDKNYRISGTERSKFRSITIAQMPYDRCLDQWSAELINGLQQLSDCKEILATKSP